jgi:hypothetical protein
LIDITPKEYEFAEILFVSDNNDFEYKGQLVDNIRINITNNPIIDDFIVLCEGTEKLYSFGNRINCDQIALPEPIKLIIDRFESLKIHIEMFVNNDSRPTSKCFCGGQKTYKNCHGQNLKVKIKSTVNEIARRINK